MNYKIGLLHTGIREDERMIIRSSKSHEISLEPIDVRKCVFGPAQADNYKSYDLMLQRCASTARAFHVIWYMEELGIPVVNDLQLSLLCSNKFATSMRLFTNNVPTPNFSLAFTEETVLKSIKNLGGFPAVMKPIKGTSWGRLMGKVNDPDAVEMLVEHKRALGINHKSFYVQQYINKPGRDIRVYTVNGETFAGIYRITNHWITNTARGAKAENCEITDEISDICRNVQDALGEGILAIDLFETDQGYTVNEVNHTMEFKNAAKITEIDIASKILDYCIEVIERR